MIIDPATVPAEVHAYADAIIERGYIEQAIQTELFFGLGYHVSPKLTEALKRADTKVETTRSAVRRLSGVPEEMI